MHSQRPRQLPHGHLSPALYRPLQVLEPPSCSPSETSIRSYSQAKGVNENVALFTPVQRAPTEKDDLMSLFPYAQVFL